MQHLNTQNLQQYMQKLKKMWNILFYIIICSKTLGSSCIMISWLKGVLILEEVGNQEEIFYRCAILYPYYLHLKSFLTYSKSNQKLIKVYDTTAIFIKSTKHLLQLLRTNLIQVITCHNNLIINCTKKWLSMIGWIKFIISS